MIALALVLFTINVKAGLIVDQARELARQLDMSVAFSFTELEHDRSPAVFGVYDRTEAWCAFLKGTRLTFELHRGPPPQIVASITPEVDSGDRDQLCNARPTGWGPPWIHPPQADWK